MSDRVAVLVEWLGLLLLSVGVGLAWFPGGLIVGGVGLMVAANFSGRGEGSS